MRASSGLGLTRTMCTRRAVPMPTSARVLRNTISGWFCASAHVALEAPSAAAPIAHNARNDSRSPLCGVALSSSTQEAVEARACAASLRSESPAHE